MLDVLTKTVPTKPTKPPKPESDHPEDRGRPWADWFAGELNEIFRRHGKLGGIAGRITGAAVRHGERTWR
jgi:hypothetical protein